MALLETEVPIREVITTDPETAKALENDVRAKIVDILADEPQSIAAIRDELQRRDEDKAATTVRHHVAVLMDAGLVEIARLEEAGGGTRKYYKANARVFSYALPDEADESLAPVRQTAVAELDALVETLYAEHGRAIEAVARELTPCDYCETQRYEEYIIRRVLATALTDLVEKDDDRLTPEE